MLTRAEYLQIKQALTKELEANPSSEERKTVIKETIEAISSLLEEE